MPGSSKTIANQERRRKKIISEAIFFQQNSDLPWKKIWCDLIVENEHSGYDLESLTNERKRGREHLVKRNVGQQKGPNKLGFGFSHAVFFFICDNWLPWTVAFLITD